MDSPLSGNNSLNSSLIIITQIAATLRSSLIFFNNKESKWPTVLQ
ncbi:hypothetical protein CZ787_09515 [Halomonas citrativorans]|uniref:Uncharacterized protein n=1 Tax=Halomonas citrativorans TaxID=2742612 RepID=A0A1R4HZS1_9GAMM|nr:hypothetical protein CZ787_09515 [Halomonas citrativorans]